MSRRERGGLKEEKRRETQVWKWIEVMLWYSSDKVWFNPAALDLLFFHMRLQPTSASPKLACTAAQSGVVQDQD